MGRPTRWVTDTKPGHSQWYIDRFRRLAAEGADLAGEARLLDAIVAPASRILDAGCGTGRVGAALAARGHHVVGVDADPALVESARADHPDLTLLVGDLAELDLPSAGEPEPFDAVVVAGNVMTFVAPGTEEEVLRRIAAHVRPDGPVVVGFGADRGYRLEDFDQHASAVGLRREQRFATWDLRPWQEDADFAVTVLRRPV
ncbi:methyltransferase family protein [Micromonospora pisi]|uniref:Methyltransferase family protein n=1 Tax=Micromonospora pisi TaxID=589240 RepID=A0A495JUP4_9ACTN|nr:class I SAM-dependent methyltransferase [Micromonospora pisi]RKR92032.1 methyltransferase family protein [Micromonospora pisi]